jgi:hypothetical protein
MRVGRLVGLPRRHYQEHELRPADMTRWKHFDVFAVPVGVGGA